MEKKAFVTKEMIEKIVEKYPTPFRIVQPRSGRILFSQLLNDFARIS